MSSSGTVGAVLLSRPVGLLAAGTIVLIFLGCMSLSFGGLSIGSHTESDGTLCQEGKVTLHGNQELEVFFPVPYVSPPNLELTGNAEHCDIIEQKPDHFRIRHRASCDACVHWQSRGLKCTLPVPAPAVFVAPPAAPPPAAPPPLAEDKSTPIPLPAPNPVRIP